MNHFRRPAPHEPRVTTQPAREELLGMHLQLEAAVHAAAAAMVQTEPNAHALTSERLAQAAVAAAAPLILAAERERCAREQELTNNKVSAAAVASAAPRIRAAERERCARDLQDGEGGKWIGSFGSRKFRPWGPKEYAAFVRALPG